MSINLHHISCTTAYNRPCWKHSFVRQFLEYAVKGLFFYFFALLGIIYYKGLFFAPFECHISYENLHVCVVVCENDNKIDVEGVQNRGYIFLKTSIRLDLTNSFLNYVSFWERTLQSIKIWSHLPSKLLLIFMYCRYIFC